MEVTFTINNNEYKVDGITIGNWYKVKEYMLVDGIEASYKVVTELSGCPTEELKQLKAHEWSTLWSTIEQYALNMNDAKVLKEIEVDGVIYGLAHMDQLRIGEFGDMELLMNDPMKEIKLHEMMAILYRPVVSQEGLHYEVERYNSIKSNRVAEKFLGVQVATVMGLISFFLNFAKESYNLTVSTLKEKVMKATKSNKQMQSTLEKLISELPEAGTIATSDLQEMTLSNLTKLQNSISSLH